MAPLADLYQVSMAYGHWRAGRHRAPAAAELFFRRPPFRGSFALGAGLAEGLRGLRAFRFSAADVAYLRSVLPSTTDDAFFDYLATLDASEVTVTAIPEGSVVFARVPFLQVKGPLLVVQLLETTLLCLVNYASLVATNAARFRLLAGPDVKLMEMGLRRAQGPDGALSASKYSYIGGESRPVAPGATAALPSPGCPPRPSSQALTAPATSWRENSTEFRCAAPSPTPSSCPSGAWRRCSHGSCRLGLEEIPWTLQPWPCPGCSESVTCSKLLPPRPTRASWPPLCPTLSPSRVTSRDCWTPTVSGGVACPISVLWPWRCTSWDTGPSECAWTAGTWPSNPRKSGEFSEPAELTSRCPGLRPSPSLSAMTSASRAWRSLGGSEIDMIGIGTNLVTCPLQPSLGCVYKLVEVNGSPCLKLTEDEEKMTIPGRKTIYRLYDAAGHPFMDLMALEEEPSPSAGQELGIRVLGRLGETTKVIPSTVEPLHRTYFRDGQVCEPLPSLPEVRTHAQVSLNLLSPAHRRLHEPQPYPVAMTERLHRLFLELRQGSH